MAEFYAVNGLNGQHYEIGAISVGTQVCYINGSVSEVIQRGSAYQEINLHALVFYKSMVERTQINAIRQHLRNVRNS